MAGYRKFIAALAATILAALVPVFADNVVTADEWANVAVMAFGAATVLGATNLPAGVWRQAKLVFAVGSAVAVAVVSALTDGQFVLAELLQLGIAALGALGVFAVPNAGAAPNGASAVVAGPGGPYAA